MKMRRLLPLGALSMVLALCLSTSSTSVRAEDAAKTGTVSGKVVDKDGNAVKEGKVFVMNPDDAPAPASGPASRPAGGGPGGGRGRIDTTKAVKSGDIKDGAYSVADVPAGKYVLIAQGAQGAGRGRANIEVTAGKETKVDDIKLQAGGGRRGGAGGGAGGGGAGGAGN